MKANPVDIFNYVVETLPDGQKLSIDCEDKGQLGRIRMALYRQRNKLTKIAPELAAIITISQRIEGKSYSIVIGKNTEDIELFTFDEEGNKIPTTLKSKDTVIRDERIRKMMLSDGKSEEEVKEYFQSQNSQ